MEFDDLIREDEKNTLNDLIAILEISARNGFLYSINDDAMILKMEIAKEIGCRAIDKWANNGVILDEKP